MSELKNRIDFVYIFDVQDGNPNGDPDAGNLPRVDPETGMGLVTDVCLKRKVRNYVQVAKDLAPGYNIFIKEKAVLNTLIDKAHEEESVKDAKDKTSAARDVMCKNYYDIRTFGAVMSTGKNAGQVRGPIQFTFARSVDAIATAEADSAADLEDTSNLQTCCRSCAVPSAGHAPVSDAFPIHRQRGARGYLDELPDGRNGCRKRLYRRAHQTYHGRHKTAR